MNIMELIKLYTFLFIIVVFAACDKEDNGTSSQFSDSLYNIRGTVFLDGDGLMEDSGGIVWNDFNKDGLKQDQEKPVSNFECI